MKRRVKILISGGGTGGHVFPAISIAGALREREPDTDILFVGAKGRMEMQRVPEAGYSIIGLPVTGFQRRLSYKNILFFYNLIVSIIRSRSIIKKFRPDVVVGVGGYASGPVVNSAASMGIPVLIQEQNSYPGVTNRILARSADKICVAYKGMEKYFPAEKLLFTGNPVRNDLGNSSARRNEAVDYFGIDPDKKVLLVLGGSLGAETINMAILEKIDMLASSGIELLWQTGENGYDRVKNTLAGSLPEGIHIFDFISRMDLAYGAADLVVSRAGALTLSELAITEKPAILVPSPNVAEDHQTRNAQALVEVDSAVMVRNSDAIEKLAETAVDLINDNYRLEELKRNIRNMATPYSARDIATEVLKLIKQV